MNHVSVAQFWCIPFSRHFVTFAETREQKLFQNMSLNFKNANWRSVYYCRKFYPRLFCIFFACPSFTSSSANCQSMTLIRAHLWVRVLFYWRMVHIRVCCFIHCLSKKKKTLLEVYSWQPSCVMSLHRWQLGSQSRKCEVDVSGLYNSSHLDCKTIKLQLHCPVRNVSLHPHPYIILNGH